MKIILYTSFDCLIKTNYSQSSIDANEHLVFDEKPSYIAVYPIGKTTLPSFEVDFSEQNSPYYRIVEKDEKILVFLLDGIFAQNLKVYSLICEETPCSIEIGKTDVTFSSSDNKKILSLPSSTLSSKCGNFHHIAYAKIQTQDLNYLIAYNTKTNQAKIFKGNNIEITKEGFKISYSLHGYKKVDEEYVVKKEGLKIEQRTFSVLGLPVFEQSLCFRFLNAVKVCDYSFAFSLLSDELKSTITENTLRDYFGKISYIFPLDENSCFAISDNKNIVYSFAISNNRINEITDNQ